MGLDVKTKNTYVRFNWSGVAAFRKWSLENLGVEPFPSWDGGNGTIAVFNRRPKNEREKRGRLSDIKTWCKAFRIYNEQFNNSISSNIVEVEWEYLRAVSWYMLMQDAIGSGFIFYG